MEFEKMTIQAFLDELASNSPAPGGGSVAALCGSLSAGLVSMVSNLTIGKEKYKADWAEMEAVVKKSEALRAKFVDLMNEDTESFNLFMAALKMPKDTDAQKAERRAALGKASEKATEIPLTTLETCAEAIALTITAAKHGNPNTASDAGSAALLAEAAAKAASYNVRINLPGIKNTEFASQCKERMAKALAAVNRDAAEVEALMNKALG